MNHSNFLTLKNSSPFQCMKHSKFLYIFSNIGRATDGIPNSGLLQDTIGTLKFNFTMELINVGNLMSQYIYIYL